MVPAMHARAMETIRQLRRGLDRTLFLDPVAAFPRLTGWEVALVVVGFLCLASILQLVRAGPTESLTSLWAEDGPIFLHGALSQGFFDAVSSTYAEYLVVVPRLIAEVGAVVPLRIAPEAMNVTAVLVVSLAGLTVWAASAAHVRDPWLRGLLVALTVLCPVASLEAVASATYVSWYLTFAAFWVLLWRPTTTWGAALGALLVLLTGLSTPTLFFFIPLAALRAIAIRDRRDALIVGAMALALAIQLPTTLLSTEYVPGREWTDNIWKVLVQRVVDGSALGLDLVGSIWEQWQWAPLIAIAVGVVLYLLVVGARASSGRLLAAIAIATGVVMFLASSYERALGNAMIWPLNSYTGQGGRYAIVPCLLIISAAFVLVEANTGSARRRRWLAAATAVVLAISLVTSFDVRSGIGRKMSPSWRQSLSTATTECETQPVTEATIPVLPPSWTMAVPCDRLESADAVAPAR